MINDILALIGLIVVVLGVLDLLFNIVPKLSDLRKRIWGRLANHIKFKSLQKKAIANNIENTVNSVANSLSRELPIGWTKKAKIEWIKNESYANIADEEIILRVKPYESQDSNLLNSVYMFFYTSIFPKTNEVIPINVIKATALQISKRTITLKQPYLLKKFEREYLDREINNDTSIANYFGKYEELDKSGFFTGFAIREIDEVAKLSRYNALRSTISDEINSILSHIINFQGNSYSHNNNDWFRHGAMTKYGYLLVAKTMHKNRLEPYLKRAKKHLDNGIQRLYIMGCRQEAMFVKRVIVSVSNIPGYHLKEIFKLNKDYRGEKDGIGALLVCEALESDSNNQIEEFFEEEN